jgi:hypothetical protein
MIDFGAVPEGGMGGRHPTVFARGRECSPGGVVAKWRRSSAAAQVGRASSVAAGPNEHGGRPLQRTDLRPSTPTRATLGAAGPASPRRLLALVTVTGFAGCALLAAPALAAPPSVPRASAPAVSAPVVALASHKCGSCHAVPAAGSRRGGWVGASVNMHMRRVALSAEQWAKIREYLGADGAGAASASAGR